MQLSGAAIHATKPLRISETIAKCIYQHEHRKQSWHKSVLGVGGAALFEGVLTACREPTESFRRVRRGGESNGFTADWLARIGGARSCLSSGPEYGASAFPIVTRPLDEPSLIEASK